MWGKLEKLCVLWSLALRFSPTKKIKWRMRMNRKLRGIMALVAVTMALVLCIPSMGQVLKGSISGTVTDPQGAVVSGATVNVKNVDTGIVSTVATDSNGSFRLNLLPIGTYTVEVTQQGFKKLATTAVV